MNNTPQRVRSRTLPSVMGTVIGRLAFGRLLIKWDTLGETVSLPNKVVFRIPARTAPPTFEQIVKYNIPVIFEWLQ